MHCSIQTQLIQQTEPEISFVYMPGSDAIPSEPTPITPLNGSWSIESGINPAPDKARSYHGISVLAVSVGGWSVELDTSNTFDSQI